MPVASIGRSRADESVAGEGGRRGPDTVVDMRLHVVDHPLVAHKLTTLRDQRTDSATFRRLADELVTLLAYEATRDVRTEQVDITTPVSPTTGVKLSYPRPLVVPILRAGLGMLDGMVRLLPTAEVGFLGMVRDEETLQASTYATRMPEDLSGRQVYVLDPMLATGGTLVAAIRELIKRGADDVTAVVLLAAPEGVEVMERELAGTPVTVVTASVDERLNEHGYIVPGLGDAGDRMYGAAENRPINTRFPYGSYPPYGSGPFVRLPVSATRGPLRAGRSSTWWGVGAAGLVSAARALSASAFAVRFLKAVPMIRSTSGALARVSVFARRR
jgi:uracil phosphoribosyltransferase